MKRLISFCLLCVLSSTVALAAPSRGRITPVKAKHHQSHHAHHAAKHHAAKRRHRTV